MIGIIAYNIADFLFEYDYYDARDIFGSEAAALKKIMEDIIENPTEVVAFLRTMDMPEAKSLADSVAAL